MSNNKSQKKYPDRARPNDIEIRKEHLESIIRSAGFYSRQLGLDEITDAYDNLKAKMQWILEEDFTDETVERFTLALEEIGRASCRERV